MKIKRTVCAFALIGLLANVSGCLSLPKVKEPLPEDTLEEFEDAFNAMDVNGMLDCMDETSVKSLTAGLDLVMGIASTVTDVDINISAEDLIAMLPLFQGMMDDYASQSGAPQVDFQVLETYIKGDRATVYFMEAGSGDQAVINMVKEDGKWLLTLSTRAVSPEDADRVITAGQEEETKSRAEERAEKRAERKAEREAEREAKRAEREKERAEDEEGDAGEEDGEGRIEELLRRLFGG